MLDHAEISCFDATARRGNRGAAPLGATMRANPSEARARREGARVARNEERPGSGDDTKGPGEEPRHRRGGTPWASGCARLLQPRIKGRVPGRKRPTAGRVGDIRASGGSTRGGVPDDLTPRAGRGQPRGPGEGALVEGVGAGVVASHLSSGNESRPSRGTHSTRSSPLGIPTRRPPLESMRHGGDATVQRARVHEPPKRETLGWCSRWRGASEGQRTVRHVAIRGEPARRDPNRKEGSRIGILVGRAYFQDEHQWAAGTKEGLAGSAGRAGGRRRARGPTSRTSSSATRQSRRGSPSTSTGADGFPPRAPARCATVGCGSGTSRALRRWWNRPG